MSLRICSKSNQFVFGRSSFNNTFFGETKQIWKTIHIPTSLRFPQALALKLPTNVVDINSSEMGRFSPLRERDMNGPVINHCFEKNDTFFCGVDITVQVDPHMNKYDCQGALSLSSSMQSNVPNPFSGNHTHLGMPGSQWGQGYKYLSDHLQSAHYLTLRNEYRGRASNKANRIATRKMSTQADTPLSTKEKMKKAVKEYGSTVIVFHVTLSIISLGGCYLLVSSGVDIAAILDYLNVGGALKNIVSSNGGTFVIAYAIHKVFAPFRIAVTLGATPFIVRRLRKMGLLKNNISTGGGK